MTFNLYQYTKIYTDVKFWKLIAALGIKVDFSNFSIFYLTLFLSFLDFPFFSKRDFEYNFLWIVLSWPLHTNNQIPKPMTNIHNQVKYQKPSTPFLLNRGILFSRLFLGNQAVAHSCWDTTMQGYFIVSLE